MRNRLNRLILVIRHATAMWRNLSHPKNAQKGGWEKIDAWHLMNLARIELDELAAAAWEFEHGRGSAERVAEEAADLSNFAAFLADNARRQQAIKQQKATAGTVTS